jgi:hypothetical protein
MAFEQNPEFRDGGIKVRQSWRELLTKNERVLYAVTGILLVIVLVLSLRALGVFSGESGGLDGCVVNTSGEPMTATAQTEKTQRSTAADGCFFFSELTPGKHELIIEVADGSIVKQAVEIVSGQAVGLGKITMP